MIVTYYTPTAEVSERADVRETDVKTGTIKIVYNGNLYYLSEYDDGLHLIASGGNLVIKTFSVKSVRLDQE